MTDQTNQGDPDAEKAERERRANLLTGLTGKQKSAIIAAAFIVVALSLAVAALVMWRALDNTHFSSADAAVVEQMSRIAGGSAETAILRVHAVDAAVNMKLVANKHAIILVAFAGAFALAAVGFALFLLGVDGAFKLEHGADASKLMLASTAPGILCFFLAAALLMTGVTHRSEINLGQVTFPGASQPAGNLTCGANRDCLRSEDLAGIAPPAVMTPTQKEAK